VFIKEAIKNGLRCAICNGYIHKNAMTIDHIHRKEDGGKGNAENGQITHPYCNTTYKN
jgi:5-methylcytosine-specific restriction endonuclease McrA